MADPYDYYRQQPASPQNPWALSGGDPQQYYGQSASIWGNNFRPKIDAEHGFGMAGLGNLYMGGLPQNAINSFGGAHELYTGQMFKNLGNADNWRNFASYGVTGAKDAQEAAKNARIAAVARWRNQQSQAIGGRLNQYGQDVYGDLGGELDKALGAGGALGDMDKIKNRMSEFERHANEYMLGRQRAGQARKVDAMFSDPRRISDQNQKIESQKRLGMGQLAEQYRIGQRDNAFNQARRGTQGGSMDVEKQGEIGRQRDIGASSLQAGLEGRAQQYRLGDAQQKNTLMGMIYGDDPQMAAQFQNQLQGINQQGALVRETAANNQQMNAQRDAASAGYSQAFGGLLTGLSQPLGYYVEHQGGGA